MATISRDWPEKELAQTDVQKNSFAVLDTLTVQPMFGYLLLFGCPLKTKTSCCDMPSIVPFPCTKDSRLTAERNISCQEWFHPRIVPDESVQPSWVCSRGGGGEATESSSFIQNEHYFVALPPNQLNLVALPPLDKQTEVEFVSQK